MLSTPNYYDIRSNDINLQYIYNITMNIFLVHLPPKSTKGMPL